MNSSPTPRAGGRAPDRRHRVVIVGGGFGGLQAARRLRDRHMRVQLIDRRNFHLFQPLLYQVATSALSPANIAAPLRHVFRRQGNVDVRLGEVVDFDPLHRRVQLADSTLIPYDSLVVAAGTVNNYFGHDGDWPQIAPGLKDIEEALEIRRRMLLAFERADCEFDPEVRQSWLTFAIVGAGPTGVELAGAIAEIARDVLRNEYRHIDTATARVLLVEGLPRVLPTYTEDSSRHARRQLERLGVEIVTDTLVSDISPTYVVLGKGDEARRVDCRTVVWTAGVKGEPLGATLAERYGAKLDRMGRVLVDETCAVPGHPNVFVIGDLAHFLDPVWNEELPCPGVAQVAIQQGAYVARLIQRRAREGRQGRTYTPEPYRFHDKGAMAVIGRGRAVAEYGSLRLFGFPAWVAWLIVHLMWLVGFGNRVLVLVQWAISYLTLNRNARLITGEADLSYVPRRSQLDKLARGETTIHPDTGGGAAGPADARAASKPEGT